MKINLWIWVQVIVTYVLSQDVKTVLQFQTVGNVILLLIIFLIPQIICVTFVLYHIVLIVLISARVVLVIQVLDMLLMLLQDYVIYAPLVYS
jgi:hypothetical protein